LLGVAYRKSRVAIRPGRPGPKRAGLRRMCAPEVEPRWRQNRTQGGRSSQGRYRGGKRNKTTPVELTQILIGSKNEENLHGRFSCYK
jgi:hypothetical protein